MQSITQSYHIHMYELHVLRKYKITFIMVTSQDLLWFLNFNLSCWFIFGFLYNTHGLYFPTDLCAFVSIIVNLCLEPNGVQ